MLPTQYELITFENEIAEIYARGEIHAPVHLRGGREVELIKIFKKEQVTQIDWIFGYWDSHELALLKEIPREKVKEEILKGNSIALCFPEYNFYCSGIVGSLMGVAVGVAWQLKNSGSKARVFHFCGDMSAETGIFHEVVKYSTQFDLPIKFIVSDNGLSVMTPTQEVWNIARPWFQSTYYEKKKIIHFYYTNKYPHSGLGKTVKF